METGKCYISSLAPGRLIQPNACFEEIGKGHYVWSSYLKQEPGVTVTSAPRIMKLGLS